jgi:hypothetical protein
MGPGHRRDVMDDHFGDSNWRKTAKMGSSPIFYACKCQMNRVAGVSHANKLKIAIREAATYREYHEDWALSLPENQTAIWQKQLTQWEEDHSALNPYEKQFSSEPSSSSFQLSF